MKKVSVAIAVYNAEKTLKRCIDSVLKQSIIEDLEIIIVNDGSTDESQNIIKEYMKKNSNIILFTQVNKGLGKTRNKGIELANSKYIAFLDSDDWVDEDYYETLYEEANINDSDLAISTHCVEVENAQRTIVKNHIVKEKYEYIRKLLKGEIEGFSWNKLYKKKFLEFNNLKFPVRGELENVEDQYFSFRCLALANEVAFVNKSNIHYVIHSNSIVRKYQGKLHLDILELYKSNCEFLRKHDLNYIEEKDLDSLLLRGIITAINNEFKPQRRATRKERIKIFRDLKNIEEYKNILSNFEIEELRRIDKIYLNLIKKDEFKLLYFIACLRCKRIHYKSKIYK